MIDPEREWGTMERGADDLLLHWCLWSVGTWRWYYRWWPRSRYSTVRWWLSHPVRWIVLQLLRVRHGLPRCAVCGVLIQTIWAHNRHNYGDGVPTRGPWVCGVECAGQLDTPMNARLRELEHSGQLVRFPGGRR